MRFLRPVFWWVRRRKAALSAPPAEVGIQDTAGRFLLDTAGRYILDTTGA